MMTILIHKRVKSVNAEKVGVICLCFFENKIGQAITVKGLHYRPMITNLYCPELNALYTNDMCFQ